MKKDLHSPGKCALLGTLCLLFFTLHLPAQTVKTLRGLVVDEAQAPLAGVTVSIKGESATTQTDSRGRYTLAASGAAPVLLFSSVGFEPLEVAAGSLSTVNVTLKKDFQSLDDVVVIGYGTQRREKVVGSVAQVSGEQISNRPVSQLKNALTGQVPGVIITTRNGSPGVSSGAISIRGVGSFGASASPLILVDGTLVDNFNDIDPNDVETISVLKDASSAAIYGSRAANGVILVTTKSGKTGTPKLSYSSYLGFQRPTALPDYVDSWEYQQAYFEAVNGSSTLTPDQQATVDKFKAGNDPEYPNVDFLGAVLSEDALQTGHSLSVSGGTAANKYNLSLGYLFQDGMVVRNDYTRYNVRLNMTTTFSPRFTLTSRLAAITSRTNEPLAPGGVSGFSGDMMSIIDQAARMPGTFVGRYDNGDFGVGLGNTGTPISNLATNSFDRQKQLHLNGSLRLDYKVLNGLKLSFIPAYVQNNGRQTVFRSTQRLNATTTIGPNFVREYANTNYYYSLQGLADYSKQIGKHFISALAGYSFEEYQADNFNAYRDNLPGNTLTVLALGAPGNQQANGTGSAYALESQFARANYSFAGKYLMEGVVRRDGSSRFPAGRKYAAFPSVAAGWRLGQEPLVRDHLPWISELKLKASWGVLGNQNISNYPYQNTLIVNNTDGSGTTYSFGGVVYQGVARTSIVDSTLHWESTRTTDVGLEAGLWQNKLTFSATYFDRYTYDILYSPAASVSNVLGYSLSQRNTGKLSNKGWEFTAAHNHTLGKLSYNLNANLTIVENKVLDLGVGNVQQPNGLVGNGSSLFIGHPGSTGSYDLFYGYVADGLFVDQADIDKWPSQKKVNPAVKPGDIRYKDISGPDGVPDGQVDATYDRVVLGSQIPKYSFGFSGGVNFRGFDASVLLQGITGVTGRLQGYASWAFYNTTGNIQRWQFEDRWTEQNPNPHAAYPRVETIPNTGVPNTLLSSFWTLDGSYLRIKNVQVGYTLPAALSQRLRLERARFYVSGDNLHTFSHYREGWDPELNGGASFYPILTTYSFGLNVSF